MKARMQIAEPCSENWNAMTPNEKGRHCDLCCKTVVDFTEWETADILQYLKSNANTCGRVKATALEPIEVEPTALIPGIMRAALPYWKKIAAVVVLLFGLSSCGNSNQTIGEVAPARVDSSEVYAPVHGGAKTGTDTTIVDTPYPPEVLGKIVVPVEKKPVKTPPPVVDTIVPILQGDIAIVDTMPAPKPETAPKKK